MRGIRRILISKDKPLYVADQSMELSGIDLA